MPSRPGLEKAFERGTVMRGELVVRPAEPHDLAVCAAIINDYIDDTQWLPRTLSREEIAALFTPDMLETRMFLVAENDANVGGYLSMDAGTGHIHGLYLSPGWRCNGAGKQLLDVAKAQHPNGLKLTVFEPNIHAKRFYEREGFTEISSERQDDTDEGVPTLMMHWRAP